MRHPIVVISEKGAGFIQEGQSWMYRNNLVSCSDTIENGCICDIETEDGKYLGTGFYSAQSHIVVRICTYDRNEEIDHDFFRKRIQQAWN